MAPVVAELAVLPEADRRAMVHYLASFQPAAPDEADVERLVAALEARTGPLPTGVAPAAARLYHGACAVCHDADGPRQFGARPALALNTSLHAGRPDNLIQVVLSGTATPAHADLGVMPGFRNGFSDRQVADLIRYLRMRSAPDKAAWTGLDASISHLRACP